MNRLALALLGRPRAFANPPLPIVSSMQILLSTLLMFCLHGVAGQASWDAALHLHINSTRDTFNARCLDGSNGGFYYRASSSSSSSRKWKFHFMGGGWCFSGPDCVGRSKSLLGSSSYWTPTLSALWAPEGAGFYGLMAANDTSINPFGDWNFVWFAYCDGSSQLSDRVDPVVVGSTTLHYRGRALLDAHLFELERLYSFLSTATEVIVSGTSAGGMSAYLQSSYIKTQLRAPGARLVAAPENPLILENPWMHRNPKKPKPLQVEGATWPLF